MLDETTIWGVAIATAVMIVVTAIKALAGEGVIKDRLAVGIALGVAALLVAWRFWAEQNQWVAISLDLLGRALIAGLTACGLYSTIKSRD